MGPRDGNAGQLLGILGLYSSCDGYSIPSVVSYHAAELDPGFFKEDAEGACMNEVFLKSLALPTTLRSLAVQQPFIARSWCLICSTCPLGSSHPGPTE